jgi:hypothetical protein
MKLFPMSNKERRLPVFARKFVAMDGESFETFLPPPQSIRPEQSLSSPTVACSDASPLESLFACHGDPHQVVDENTQPQSVSDPMDVNMNCGVYYTTANALKSAFLMDDDDDLKCGVYDSAARALRTALQLDNRDEEQVQIQMDDDNDSIGLDTVLIDNTTSSPGAVRLTEEGLKRLDRKSYNQPIYAPSDTHESYNQWKQQTEMRKWWKQTKRKAMERESRGGVAVAPKAPMDKGSKNVANHQSGTMEMAKANRPTRPTAKWSLFWFKKTKKTTQQSQPTTSPDDDDDDDDVDTAHVNNTCLETPNREQKRIQQLRENELERQRKREADAKNNLPSSPIKSLDESKCGLESGVQVVNRSMEHLREKEQPKQHQHQQQQRRQQHHQHFLSSFLHVARSGSESNKSQKKRPSSNTTIKSTCQPSVSTLRRLCSVCCKNERTHIATPCMHFMFCEPCAQTLAGMPCPICRGTEISTYTQVLA